MHSAVTLAAFLCTAAAALPAQAFDVIGITFQGQIMRINSATGATQALGTAPAGGNGMAIDRSDRIWTTMQTGTVGALHFHLAVIDPLTGVATQPFGTLDVGDLRGLAAEASGDLFAVRNGTQSDELVRIDTGTGAVTVIGSMGFTGVQALDDSAGGLVAWDVNAGLLDVDPLTGVATVRFPGATVPAGMQWLATDPVSRTLFVGRSTMQVVDLQTGQVGPSIAVAGAPDLRGAEFTLPRAQPFGQGCGPSPRIGGRFNFNGGQVMRTFSGTHTIGAFGAQVVGLSNSSHLGQPLPIALDPLVGTVGCSVLVSMDVTQFGVVDATGFLIVPIAIPAAMHWQLLFAQHAVFEPAAPGGLVVTQGLHVRTAL
ncbi:MAG: hypothetical protein U1E73_00360 [Planctomycetota bacterium]